MPLDKQLLSQVLRTPKNREVTESPIVTAIILQDPANAADLVEALEEVGSLEAYNARKILCQFQPNAVPALAQRLTTAGRNARRQGLDVLWALLITESPTTVRNSLSGVKNALNQLLDDKTPLPDDVPENIERDFLGRICDLAYIWIRLLLSPSFDQSLFRSLDDKGRDQEIDALKRSDFSMPLMA
jgi:hypothetical protein